VVLNVNKNNPPEIENTIKKSATDYKWEKIYYILFNKNTNELLLFLTNCLLQT